MKIKILLAATLLAFAACTDNDLLEIENEQIEIKPEMFDPNKYTYVLNAKLDDEPSTRVTMIEEKSGGNVQLRPIWTINDVIKVYPENANASDTITFIYRPFLKYDQSKEGVDAYTEATKKEIQGSTDLNVPDYYGMFVSTDNKDFSSWTGKIYAKKEGKKENGIIRIEKANDNTSFLDGVEMITEINKNSLLKTENQTQDSIKIWSKESPKAVFKNDKVALLRIRVKGFLYPVYGGSKMVIRTISTGEKAIDETIQDTIAMFKLGRKLWSDYNKLPNQKPFIEVAKGNICFTAEYETQDNNKNKIKKHSDIFSYSPDSAKVFEIYCPIEFDEQSKQKTIKTNEYITVKINCEWSRDTYIWRRLLNNEMKLEPGKTYSLDFSKEHPEIAINIGERSINNNVKVATSLWKDKKTGKAITTFTGQPNASSSEPHANDPVYGAKAYLLCNETGSDTIKLKQYLVNNTKGCSWFVRTSTANDKGIEYVLNDSLDAVLNSKDFHHGWCMPTFFDIVALANQWHGEPKSYAANQRTGHYIYIGKDEVNPTIGYAVDIDENKYLYNIGNTEVVIGSKGILYTDSSSVIAQKGLYNKKLMTQVFYPEKFGIGVRNDAVGFGILPVYYEDDYNEVTPWSELITDGIKTNASTKLFQNWWNQYYNTSNSSY